MSKSWKLAAAAILVAMGPVPAMAANDKVKEAAKPQLQVSFPYKITNKDPATISALALTPREGQGKALPIPLLVPLAPGQSVQGTLTAPMAGKWDLRIKAADHEMTITGISLGELKDYKIDDVRMTIHVENNCNRPIRAVRLKPAVPTATRSLKIIDLPLAVPPGGGMDVTALRHNVMQLYVEFDKNDGEGRSFEYSGQKSTWACTPKN